MKGIIFNLVEEAFVAEYGEGAWDTLLDSSGLNGVYTSLGNYADTEFAVLIEEAARTVGTTPAELARSMGHEAALGLAARFPHYFEPHTETRSFLLTLEDVIHPEVRKVHPDTAPPEFWFGNDDPRRLRIHYRSQRRLCALAEGMIGGAATHFGEQARLVHQSCMLDGEDHCVIDARFEAR